MGSLVDLDETTPLLYRDAIANKAQESLTRKLWMHIMRHWAERTSINAALELFQEAPPTEKIVTSDGRLVNNLRRCDILVHGKIRGTEVNVPVLLGECKRHWSRGRQAEYRKCQEQLKERCEEYKNQAPSHRSLVALAILGGDVRMFVLNAVGWRDALHEDADVLNTSSDMFDNITTLDSQTFFSAIDRSMVRAASELIQRADRPQHPTSSAIQQRPAPRTMSSSQQQSNAQNMSSGQYRAVIPRPQAGPSQPAARHYANPGPSQQVVQYNTMAVNSQYSQFQMPPPPQQTGYDSAPPYSRAPPNEYAGPNPSNRFAASNQSDLESRLLRYFEQCGRSRNNAYAKLNSDVGIVRGQRQCSELEALYELARYHGVI